MAFRRVFLGHERPALQSAAEWLLQEYAHGQQADLRQLVLVVPGSRAGRRLLELLVEAASTAGLCLTPPLIETEGMVGEQLYHPRRPFATDFVQRLVWAEVMRSADAEVLRAVVARPPLASDRTRWLVYGELMRKQHVELAADGLDFGDVAAHGAALEGFTEHARWKALHRLQQSYHDRLDALNLWDRQTARLVAIEKKECRTDRRILLIGTVDLNVTLRNMLEQVADNVTALIFAPADWQERFDGQGCLIPANWEQLDAPIQTTQIQVVDRPADQAVAVAGQLAALNGKHRGDEIVIGVPDKALIPDLERRLHLAGVTARWGPGEPLSHSPPLRLLESVASYLEQRDFRAFAALVRHPDLGRCIAQAHVVPNWLEQLDEYQNACLPSRIAESTPAAHDEHPPLRPVVTVVQELVGELNQHERPLGEWGRPIWQILNRCYGTRALDTEVSEDRIVHVVCTKVRETLLEQGQVPVPIMPDVTAAQAIRWLLDELRAEAIPPPMAADSIELLGWLELPLDDAPVLIVTGFNEGYVPQSLNSDLFMPNSLRQRLGILDNARRYARDVYAVHLMAASRSKLSFIVGRRNHDGDPQAPSRLLFACDPDTTVHRARQFFQPRSTPRESLAAATERADAGALAVPRPLPNLEPLSRLRVTAFRDYLGCPYRFYLRHIENLRSVDDALDELDGSGFGSLAHEVLRDFGDGPRRHSCDADEIAGALDRELDRRAAGSFGRYPLPAVSVQVEQLRWRLHAFARKQAEWRRQGWRIKSVEVAITGDSAAPFEVDQEPFWLTGRIDRIDIHQSTGEHAILDYKTSDAGLLPQATHQKRGEWVDLQLPLYRHLARSLKIPEPVKLGYILLPKDGSATRFALAGWDDDELTAADECARQVVRCIRQQKFWPPADPAPDFTDEFDPICQTAVLSRPPTV